MKAAISIPDEIFKDIEQLSKELKRSRSKVIADAAKEYIEKQKNLKMLETLNAVYSEEETKQESDIRDKGKKQYSKLAGMEKW
ncbi:MAG: ribbon-helix-helix protein, CopG family [Nitrospinae bacterium]|nr:ribbon-helix-helix protein, CopG family [Nitrospinota bacterium]